MNEILNMIAMKSYQLAAVAQVIAELDGRETLSYGVGADALDVAVNLALLLEEDGRKLLRDISSHAARYYHMMHEAVTAAEMLADLAECARRDDAGSVEKFFSMAYLTERTMTQARDELNREAFEKTVA